MRINPAATVILIATFQLLFLIAGKGQGIDTAKVTLGLKDASLETAIKKIEQQCSFRFFYHNDDVVPVIHLNLTSGTRTIQQTLEALLQNTSLTFRQIDQKILLERKDRQAAYEIKGRVLDITDKKPVANASVFLSNSTVGSNAAGNGAFTLLDIKPGKYELVVSVVGFGTYHQPITVNETNINLPDIEISPKTIALNEVQIKSRFDPERERNYEWFKEEFLGTSELAQQCKIVNPEVIDLDYNGTTDKLTASSNDFIVIQNQALGYKIKYLLTSFSTDGKNIYARKVHFEGSVLFENMMGTPSQQRRWEKRRLKVYEGSAMHFLRSALENRIAYNGFRVVRMVRYPNPERLDDSIINVKINYYKKLRVNGADTRDSLHFWSKKLKLPKMLDKLEPYPLIKGDIIKKTNQQGLFAFACDKDSLYITYNKYHHFNLSPQPIYMNEAGNKDNTLVSFYEPFAFFDNNGEVVNPNSLTFSGVWGRNRVAELLPVDYDPDQHPAVNDNIASKTLDTALRVPLETKLLKLKATSDSINETRATEKLYVQFDKPYYAIGDTIWFKIYLLNTAYLTASANSDIIYFDIANDSNKVIKQLKLHAQSGLSWGNISLDAKEFKPGTYTIRTYTNWMRNFGDDYFFTKTIYVTGANENNWLVNILQSTSTGNANPSNVKLQFSDINKLPLANKTIQLKVLTENKTLYKQGIQTDQNGLLDINFKLPEKASRVVIVGESERKDTKVIIPFNLNRVENIDVQFLPEGGHLVAGLPAHIGFKAIGENGKGVEVSGIITGQDQNKVAEFRSLHNGMGSFILAIKDGERYMAKVTLPGGLVKEYPLPNVKNTGTILQIKNLPENDSLAVTVAATSDIVRSGNSFFLIGKSRGIVCYGAIVSFHAGNFIKRKIDKHLFPSGIAHFTLMTAGREPLNERMVFIDHQDYLNVEFAANKLKYTVRDSIAMQIKVTDDEGNPVSGNFSLAVTDDAEVKTNTLGENILARMLLTSDLKGYVEEPGYYISSKTDEAALALDNLLLTQGWIGYNWHQVLNPPPDIYRPEHEFAVNGRVANVFNNPVKGTDVILFSKSPAILMDTTTNNDGRFTFQHFPHVDTPVFIIRAVNKRGKSFNVNVGVDEIAPAVFTAPKWPEVVPWYVNSDTTLINFVKNNAREKKQDIAGTGHVLKEVKITAKKIIKGSQNLNGPGNGDLVMDEKDIEKEGKKTLFQLFGEKIDGFREGMITPTYDWYFVKDKIVVLFVDGVDYSEVMHPAGIDDFRRYLQSLSAEDVKGMEVNFSGRYTSDYERRHPEYEMRPPKFRQFAFIEITTRSGNGPVISNTPGLYLYKPLPFARPGQFYKPKYAVKDVARQTSDLRSTIAWEPNITTNEKGVATIFFYAADKPSTYTVIVEGTDMNGNIGSKTGKIVVDGKRAGTK